MSTYTGFSMRSALVVPVVAGVLLLKSQMSALHFDEAEATRAVYEKYNPDQDTASAYVPQNGHANLSGSEFKPGDPLVVRPFWHATYRAGVTRRAVLLTYAVPFEPNWKPIVPGDKPFSCHACTPLIGVALFNWSGSRWVPSVSEVAVLSGGGFGQPPSSARLVKCGSHELAVQIDDGYSGGGVTTTSVNIIALHRATISRALHVTTGEDNLGGCERHQPSDEPACYRYRKTINWTPGPNPDLYDIRTVLRGTDYDEASPTGVRPVAGSELFRFVGNAYTSIERHGSITGTENATSP